jgi:hypothetical protein
MDLYGFPPANLLGLVSKNAYVPVTTNQLNYNTNFTSLNLSNSANAFNTGLNTNCS